MIGAAASGYWLLTNSTFQLEAPRVSGELRFVDGQQTVAATLTGEHPNVFQINTDAIRRRLLTQPAIADASVAVVLPNTLEVALSERTPVFAITRSGATAVVDGSGQVLALVDPSLPAALAIPVINDQRTGSAQALEDGISIDPIDVAAILQLGALTPRVVESTATSLALSVRDDDGFVLTAQPSGWQAIFGQYTPNLRPTDIIPRQVQCLRSLVAAAETNLKTVYLSPLDDGCGTYLPVETPRVPTPAPTRSR
jgi:hypothetical protein